MPIGLAEISIPCVLVAPDTHPISDSHSPALHLLIYVHYAPTRDRNPILFILEHTALSTGSGT